ncbi:MAG: hypothetical protein HOC23_00635 [Halieaceae bacterium]|jgi:hypothetical protein|nr:hypothetical protein [Halieaceae bacterium]
MHIRTIVLLILLSFLAGCKLQVVVPVGGTVTTASGTYTCAAGQTCEIDVVDLLFDETFTAVPDDGYQFDQWKKKQGGRGFCATVSARHSPCRLYTSFFGGWPNLFSFLATDEVFYLEPVFSRTFWIHDDVKALDDWGENTDEHSDLIALYQKEQADSVSFRIDYMNLSDASVAPTFLGLDFKSGGVRKVLQGNNGIKLDIRWDLLILIDGGDVAVFDSSFKRIWGMVSNIEIDRYIDSLSFELDKTAMRGWDGGDFSLQALTTNAGQTSVIDSSSMANTGDVTGRGKLVLALNTAAILRAPFWVREYDGFDFAFEEDRPGVRRGYRYIIDAAEKYGVPIALTDVRVDTLAGYDYLGLSDQFRSMHDKGLLDLFSNTSYGQFMNWWPDEANLMAIELTKAAKQKADIPESGVFYPYESMARVRDIELLLNCIQN